MFINPQWSLCALTSPSIYKQNASVWIAESAAVSDPVSDPPTTLEQPTSGFYFTSCQWTPDGSSLLTTSSDNVVRVFVAPLDLLTRTSQHLLPYSRLRFPSAATLAAYPGFQISEYAPAMVLASVAEHPIKLYNVHSKECVASYPSVNPHNEAFDNPIALAFASQDADMFLAGTSGQRGKVSLFSLLRPGSSPESSPPVASTWISQDKALGYRRSVVSTIAPRPAGTDLVCAVGFYQGGTAEAGKSDGIALYDFRVDRDNGRCTMVSPEIIPPGDSPQAGGSWRKSVSGTTKILWSPADSAMSEHLVYQIPRNGYSNVIVRDERMGLQQVDELVGPSKAKAKATAWAYNPTLPPAQDGNDNDSGTKRKSKSPRLFPTQQRLGADWIKLSQHGNSVGNDTTTEKLGDGNGNGNGNVNKNGAYSLCVGTTQGSVYIYNVHRKTANVVQVHQKGTSVCGVSSNPAVITNGLEVLATCSGNRQRGNTDNETSIKLWRIDKS